MKKIILTAIFVFLVNLVPLLAVWSFSLVRPVVNIDYFFAMAFYVLGFWWLGLLFFIISFFADVLSLVAQLFPFFRFGELVYMSRFLGFAPFAYQAAAIAVIAYFVFLVFLHLSFASGLSRGGVLLLLVLFGGCFVGSTYSSAKKMTYREPPGYFSSSQLEYLVFSRMVGFSERVRQGDAGFAHYPGDRAISIWEELKKEERPGKALFIVAESWGVPLDPLVQEYILSPLYGLEGREIEGGVIRFSGATVEGELKELCGLMPSTYDVRGIPEVLAKKCFPSTLRKSGYKTFSFHGASSTMYDRYLWYPLIGFDTPVFFESKRWGRRCYSFPGACDVDIFDKISKIFDANEGEKAFVYWLTLNSHSPYDERDIFADRFDCARFSLSEGEVCNNLRLHAQFFYYLARFLESPEVGGVEVIVVSDHEPRFFSDVSYLADNFEVGEVPWVRISSIR